ncbi:MAG: class I SAM-dependent methyltransferase [Bryobacteraceae bacterium]|nr:class I SAM-dependent methyltransferase [Bryobacteraceae bacterium]
MASKDYLLPANIAAYLAAISPAEHPVLAAIRRDTEQHPLAIMQIPPEQGVLLQFLVKLTAARNVIEIGVFTGYSSTAMALALPEDGRLLACDVSEEYLNTASGYWKQAGVEHRIVARKGPAIETLDRLLSEGNFGAFDLAFIDADKPGYSAYYERLLELLRPGGLIVVDNVFLMGEASDPETTNANALAVRAFNRALREDPRVDFCVIPMADGITLARKK